MPTPVRHHHAMRHLPVRHFGSTADDIDKRLHRSNRLPDHPKVNSEARCRWACVGSQPGESCPTWRVVVAGRWQQQGSVDQATPANGGGDPDDEHVSDSQLHVPEQYHSNRPTRGVWGVWASLQWAASKIPQLSSEVQRITTMRASK